MQSSEKFEGVIALFDLEYFIKRLHATPFMLLENSFKLCMLSYCIDKQIFMWQWEDIAKF
jgi:hypothetical protein